VIFPQEVAKFEKRLPEARKFIQEHKLNEFLGPDRGDVGIIVQGGLFNALNSRLALAGLSDVYGDLKIPTLVLNVTHPLVPEEITGYCAGKRAVLLVEE
jgi:indolepyruvate ferredoxin oxidoreductase alpha subunit